MMYFGNGLLDMHVLRLHHLTLADGSGMHGRGLCLASAPGSPGNGIGKGKGNLDDGSRGMGGWRIQIEGCF